MHHGHSLKHNESIIKFLSSGITMSSLRLCAAEWYAPLSAHSLHSCHLFLSELKSVSQAESSRWGAQWHLRTSLQLGILRWGLILAPQNLDVVMIVIVDYLEVYMNRPGCLVRKGLCKNRPPWNTTGIGCPILQHISHISVEQHLASVGVMVVNERHTTVIDDCVHAGLFAVGAWAGKMVVWHWNSLHASTD